MEPVWVSVVLPAYQAADFLETAVRSVLEQSHSAFELLIIDDASQDHTEKLARYFAGQDARVRYHRMPVHGGVAVPGLGVRLARFDWIAFLDSDDRWRPDKLARQIAYVRAHAVDMVYTGYDFMDAAGRKSPAAFPVPGAVTYRQLLRQNVISCSGIMLRKRWCQQVPMRTGALHEDFWAWLTMLRQGAEAGGIDLPLQTGRVGRPSAQSPAVSCTLRGGTWRTYRTLGLLFMEAAYYMICYFCRSLKSMETSFWRPGAERRSVDEGPAGSGCQPQRLLPGE